MTLLEARAMMLCSPGLPALTDYSDDSIMTHVPFAVVSRDGQLLQLNQNGTKESSLTRAVRDANLSMHGKLFTAKNFSAA